MIWVKTSPFSHAFIYEINGLKGRSLGQVSRGQDSRMSFVKQPYKTHKISWKWSVTLKY